MASKPPGHYGHLPIKKALLLDPWVEALPAKNFPPSDAFVGPGLADGEANRFNVPMLVINSEQFTVWKNHYMRVQEILRDWSKPYPKEPTLLTLGTYLHITLIVSLLTVSCSSKFAPGVLRLRSPAPWIS